MLGGNFNNTQLLSQATMATMNLLFYIIMAKNNNDIE